MRTRSRKRMEEIEGFVNEYTMKNHCSPSIQTIADAIGVSKSTAFYYLRDMNNLGILEYDGKEIRTKKTSKVSSGLTGAAILGSVSCGVPLLEEENVEEYVNLPTSLFGNGSFFILRANGDSMTGAGIDDGDLVIVRKEEQAQEERNKRAQPQPPRSVFFFRFQLFQPDFQLTFGSFQLFDGVALTTVPFHFHDTVRDIVDLLFQQPLLPFLGNRDSFKLAMAKYDGIIIAGSDTCAELLAVCFLEIFPGGYEDICTGI